MRLLVLAALAGATVGSARFATAGGPPDLVVIVHADNPAQPSFAAVESYFLKKERRWGDDTLIVPLNTPPGSEARVAFDRAVLRLSPDESARYWIDVRIRSGDTAPKEVADPVLVVKLVGKLKPAIAYVPASTALSGVRVVARISGGKLVPP